MKTEKELKGLLKKAHDLRLKAKMASDEADAACAELLTALQENGLDKFGVDKIAYVTISPAIDYKTLDSKKAKTIIKDWETTCFNPSHRKAYLRWK